MTPEEVADLIRLAGHEVRVQGEEVKFRFCIFCGNDRWNLEVNPTKGVYSCWACGNSGRADSFLQRLTGEDVSLSVDLDQTAISRPDPIEDDTPRVPASSLASSSYYLGKRGVTNAAADRYEISVCTARDHALYARILFPLRTYFSRQFIGFLGRTYINQRPKYMTNAVRKAICGWRRPGRPLIIVEGPFDALAVVRAGYSAAMLLGTSSDQVAELVQRHGYRNPEPAAILLDSDAQDQALRLTAAAPGLRFLDLRVGDPADYDPSVLGRWIDDRLRNS